ncbi:Twinkle, mitochondrial, partial [Paramuricea clavata]
SVRRTWNQLKTWGGERGFHASRSSSHGLTRLSSLPPEVLPHLEQFGKIILWFRNDVRSRQAANKFARKLNIQRCHFVRMETS